MSTETEKVHLNLMTDPSERKSDFLQEIIKSIPSRSSVHVDSPVSEEEVGPGRVVPVLEMRTVPSGSYSRGDWGRC